MTIRQATSDQRRQAASAPQHSQQPWGTYRAHAARRLRPRNPAGLSRIGLSIILLAAAISQLRAATHEAIVYGFLTDETALVGRDSLIAGRLGRIMVGVIDVPVDVPNDKPLFARFEPRAQYLHWYSVDRRKRGRDISAERKRYADALPSDHTYISIHRQYRDKWWALGVSLEAVRTDNDGRLLVTRTPIQGTLPPNSAPITRYQGRGRGRRQVTNTPPHSYPVWEVKRWLPDHVFYHVYFPDLVAGNLYHNALPVGNGTLVGSVADYEFIAGHLPPKAFALPGTTTSYGTTNELTVMTGKGIRPDPNWQSVSVKAPIRQPSIVFPIEESRLKTCVAPWMNVGRDMARASDTMRALVQDDVNRGEAAEPVATKREIARAEGEIASSGTAAGQVRADGSVYAANDSGIMQDSKFTPFNGGFIPCVRYEKVPGSTKKYSKRMIFIPVSHLGLQGREADLAEMHNQMLDQKEVSAIDRLGTIEIIVPRPFLPDFKDEGRFAGFPWQALPTLALRNRGKELAKLYAAEGEKQIAVKGVTSAKITSGDAIVRNLHGIHESGQAVPGLLADKEILELEIEQLKMDKTHLQDQRGSWQTQLGNDASDRATRIQELVLEIDDLDDLIDEAALVEDNLDLIPGWAATFGMGTDPVTTGQEVVVNAVNPGGTAEALGLRAGDLLLRIGDKEVDSGTSEVHKELGFLVVGASITVTVRRQVDGNWEEVQLDGTVRQAAVGSTPPAVLVTAHDEMKANWATDLTQLRGDRTRLQTEKQGLENHVTPADPYVTREDQIDKAIEDKEDELDTLKIKITDESAKAEATHELWIMHPNGTHSVVTRSYDTPYEHVAWRHWPDGRKVEIVKPVEDTINVSKLVGKMVDTKGIMLDPSQAPHRPRTKRVYIYQKDGDYAKPGAYQDVAVPNDKPLADITAEMRGKEADIRAETKTEADVKAFAEGGASDGPAAKRTVKTYIYNPNSPTGASRGADITRTLERRDDVIQLDDGNLSQKIAKSHMDALGPDSKEHDFKGEVQVFDSAAVTRHVTTEQAIYQLEEDLADYMATAGQLRGSKRRRMRPVMMAAGYPSRYFEVGNNEPLPAPGSGYPVKPEPTVQGTKFGVPVYDVDGDGAADRFYSSDPWSNGFPYIHFEWNQSGQHKERRSGITVLIDSIIGSIFGDFRYKVGYPEVGWALWGIHTFTPDGRQPLGKQLISYGFANDVSASIAYNSYNWRGKEKWRGSRKWNTTKMESYFRPKAFLPWKDDNGGYNILMRTRNIPNNIPQSFSANLPTFQELGHMFIQINDLTAERTTNATENNNLRTIGKIFKSVRVYNNIFEEEITSHFVDESGMAQPDFDPGLSINGRHAYHFEVRTINVEDMTESVSNIFWPADFNPSELRLRQNPELYGSVKEAWEVGSGDYTEKKVPVMAFSHMMTAGNRFSVNFNPENSAHEHGIIQFPYDKHKHVAAMNSLPSVKRAMKEDFLGTLVNSSGGIGGLVWDMPNGRPTLKFNVAPMHEGQKMVRLDDNAYHRWSGGPRLSKGESTVKTTQGAGFYRYKGRSYTFTTLQKQKEILEAKWDWWFAKPSSIKIPTYVNPFARKPIPLSRVEEHLAAASMAEELDRDVADKDIQKTGWDQFSIMTDVVEGGAQNTVIDATITTLSSRETQLSNEETGLLGRKTELEGFILVMGEPWSKEVVLDPRSFDGVYVDIPQGGTHIFTGHSIPGHSTPYFGNDLYSFQWIVKDGSPAARPPLAGGAMYGGAGSGTPVERTVKTHLDSDIRVNITYYDSDGYTDPGKWSNNGGKMRLTIDRKVDVDKLNEWKTELKYLKERLKHVQKELKDLEAEIKDLQERRSDGGSMSTLDGYLTKLDVEDRKVQGMLDSYENMDIDSEALRSEVKYYQGRKQQIIQARDVLQHQKDAGLPMIRLREAKLAADRRRLMMDQGPIYIFSGAGGRNEELEMATRMPKGVRLVCVEWDDRQFVSRTLQKYGKTCEFIGKTPDEQALYETTGFNISGAEARFRSDIIENWFDRSRYQFYLESGRDYFNGKGGHENSAYLTETKRSSNSGGGAAEQLQRVPVSGGKYGNIIKMIMGVGKMIEGVNDLRSDLAYRTTTTTDDDWLYDQQCGRLNYPAFVINDGEIDIPQSQEMSRRTLTPIVQFRHPMLLYYLDTVRHEHDGDLVDREISAIYVRYGSECDPALAFGNMSKYTAISVNVDPDAVENARRQRFVQWQATDRNLKRVYHDKFPEMQRLEDEYNSLKNIDWNSITDPGDPPVGPTAPTEPPVAKPSAYYIDDDGAEVRITEPGPQPDFRQLLNTTGKGLQSTAGVLNSLDVSHPAGGRTSITGFAFFPLGRDTTLYVNGADVRVRILKNINPQVQLDLLKNTDADPASWDYGSFYNTVVHDGVIADGSNTVFRGSNMPIMVEFTIEAADAAQVSIDMNTQGSRWAPTADFGWWKDWPSLATDIDTFEGAMDAWAVAEQRYTDYHRDLAEWNRLYGWYDQALIQHRWDLRRHQAQLDNWQILKDLWDDKTKVNNRYLEVKGDYELLVQGWEAFKKTVRDDIRDFGIDWIKDETREAYSYFINPANSIPEAMLDLNNLGP